MKKPLNNQRLCYFSKLCNLCLAKNPSIVGKRCDRSSLFPEREAHYGYYKHGPLARTDLGQLRVQGQDYAYTLQGWLKGINPAMGGTLTNGTDTTEGYPTAQDAYAFSLHYYRNDYKAIGYTPQSATVLGALGSNAAPLYNGNIAAMAVNIPKLGTPNVYNYHYDQLNRLVTMDAFNGLNVSNGTFTPANITDYKERFTYNPDGGILTLLRNGTGGTVIDNANWNYYAGAHRLEHISDPAGRFGFDAGNQGINNYTYDAIGEMTGDVERGLTNDWTVYGKLNTQTINGTTISYTYDANGNRISKTLSNGYKEFYVSDAQGNVLSIYRSGDATINNGELTQTEVQLYGSSRLGTNKPNTNVQNVVVNSLALNGGFGTAVFSIFTRGNKFFDLSDHRSNNLVTISDRRQQQSAAGTIVDYYTADIITARDYSSFGSLLQGRQYGNTSRYTYNGKQLDTETGWQDYGMRSYLVDVPVFGSVDPLTGSYPWYTPYQFAGNKPIWATDLDGLEEMKANSVANVIKDINGNIITKPTIINDPNPNADIIPGVKRLNASQIEVTPGLIGGTHPYFNTFTYQQINENYFTINQTNTPIGQEAGGTVRPPQNNLVQQNDGDNDVTVPNNPKPVISVPRINGKPIGNSPINLPLNVSFDANTDNINNKASVMKQVKQIVTALKIDSKISISLLGNVLDPSPTGPLLTDPNQPTTLNGQPSTTQGLQTARAKAVADLLIKQGVNPKQVKYGSGAVSKDPKKGLSTDAIIKRKK